MRLATIDIGTNSVLLLVAERTDAGEYRAVLERATITRLGQGVDQTRTLSAEGIQRTVQCLATYAGAIRDAGATLHAAVATSAARDAAHGSAFLAQAEAALGFRPSIIGGEREAELTFRGALSGLSLRPAQSVMVFDVGGGSTEFVFGDTSGRIERAISLDIGSVRLTERFVRSDPPTREELWQVRRFVQSELARVAPAEPPSVVVGVAGTVTTLSALAHDVTPYDGARVHGSSLTAEAASSLRKTLADAPLIQRQRLPGLEPKRADVIVAGAIIVEEIYPFAPCRSLIASDRGVRWGLLPN